MGNIGRSSTGCYLCRKRKIKCDEGKPGCKRCAQIRKPCPGYPFQVQLQLRPPPAGVAESSSSKDGFAASASTPATDDQQSEAAELDQDLKTARIKIKTEIVGGKPALQKLVPARRSISPPPRYDIQHQSICFFLNLFCFQAGRLYQFPVLDFLPSVLETANDYTCVYKAAMAVSRMTLADRYSGNDVRLQTGKEYGHALSLTNATIRDTAASIKDETVIAVWLLGLYESISVVLTHGRTGPGTRTLEEEWQSHLLHVRGAMNLLRLRGMSQFSTPRGEKIFRIFKAAIQMRLFILNSVTSKDFDDLEIDVFQDEHEFVPSQTANKATGYFHHVARLLEKIKQYNTRRADDPAQTKARSDLLLQYGETLDEGMAGWSKDEPGWDMMRVRAEVAGTMWALYPSHAIYYFYSFWVFLYWLRFLTARVKLYEALIELLKVEIQDQSPGGRRSSSAVNLRISKFRTIIQMTASELIGLTAYALGDVTPTGAFHSSISARNPRMGFQEINVIAVMQLVIPLKLLQRCEYLTATQKGAVDLAISHVGDGFRRQPLL